MDSTPVIIFQREGLLLALKKEAAMLGVGLKGAPYKALQAASG